MMKKKDTKIIILVLSVFFLLVVHILKGNHVATAIGEMFVEIIVGFIVGGVILFNVLLFFFNTFKPENNLNFDIKDKFTAGDLACNCFEGFKNNLNLEQKRRQSQYSL